MVLYMERKLREIKGSLVITLPKYVCDLYDFKVVDKLSIEPISVGELHKYGVIKQIIILLPINKKRV